MRDPHVGHIQYAIFIEVPFLVVGKDYDPQVPEKCNMSCLGISKKVTTSLLGHHRPVSPWPRGFDHLR